MTDDQSQSAPAKADDTNAPKAFVGSRIRDLKEVLVGELLERGYWVVANVETTSYWPVTAQKIAFGGEIVWIFPITNKHYPAVAMQMRPGQDRAACERLLMRFLSVLSWVTGHGISADGIGGGSLPVPLGREKTMGFSITEEFDLSYFPEPKDEKAQLALALMREGRALNHPGYAFLSFYRVLEVAFPDGLARGQWISQQVNGLTGFGIKEALERITAAGITDVGVHLRDSGRRAMAHAREEPIIDPDDPADARRLRDELPIMVALATLAIEQVFGVETSMTVYRKHLYELAGFKAIVEEDVAAKLARNEALADDLTFDVPWISVRLRGHAPFGPLENLQPTGIGRDGSVIFLQFQSEDGNLQFRFGLDFANERLEFNMFRDIAMRDSGTADGALAVIECKRFLNEYFGNGQLEIYDAETGALLSRKDAYIPLNMMFNHKAAEAELEHWRQLVEERRQAA